MLGVKLVYFRIIYIKAIFIIIKILFIFGVIPIFVIFVISQQKTLINWLVIIKYPSWLLKEKKSQI